MKTRLVFACALAALALACGPKRRPAVVASGGAAAATVSPTGAGTATPEPERPIDAGPDVQPIREDGASGRELPGAEGGALADIHFEFDRAAFDDAAIATLQKHAQWLQQNPGAKLTVEGHCDERGTVEYNLALGDLRAQAVREYLVSLGVAPERLVTVSYGKEQPFERASGEAAFARNRRAHFVVQR
jgi:peptidoglycan-associated lipoprotein